MLFDLTKLHGTAAAATTITITTITTTLIMDLIFNFNNQHLFTLSHDIIYPNNKITNLYVYNTCFTELDNIMSEDNQQR